MTNYAAFCDDELISVFEATSLAEAVKIKTQLQAQYNRMQGCDEVFHLRKATRAERRYMKRNGWPCGAAEI